MFILVYPSVCMRACMYECVCDCVCVVCVYVCVWVGGCVCARARVFTVVIKSTLLNLFSKDCHKCVVPATLFLSKPENIKLSKVLLCSSLEIFNMFILALNNYSLSPYQKTSISSQKQTKKLLFIIRRGTFRSEMISCRNFVNILFNNVLHVAE